jgi:redox-sensitive bicupin YhaK (pirin superfamily)
MQRVGRRQVVLGGLLGLASVSVGCTPSGPRRARREGARAERVRSPGAREVDRIVRGLPSRDGAGVSLTRLLGQPTLPHLDPFILLDEIHSSNPREYEAGFPTHPHRGFETVSIMLDGQMRHRDSRGNSGLITGGGSQWMTAGSGILHSEMPERSPGDSTELWGFQLWVNLPEAERWRAPEYQDLVPARLAEVGLDRGGRLRVISGEALGARGPVAPRATEPLLLTLALERGDEVELDVARGHAAMVVVAEGTAEIGERRDAVPESSLVVTTDGERLRLGASEGPAQLVVIAGRPLQEPFVHRGPFVMGTMGDIEQAYEDYRAGRLG